MGDMMQVGTFLGFMVIRSGTTETYRRSIDYNPGYERPLLIPSAALNNSLSPTYGIVLTCRKLDVMHYTAHLERTVGKQNYMLYMFLYLLKIQRNTHNIYIQLNKKGSCLPTHLSVA
jgi:hypothetical protein